MSKYGHSAARQLGTGEDLVAQHAELVKRIAHHLSARLPATVDVNDLIQAGMVGLLEAASNFDASRGASFETYAGIRIRGAMLDDVRKHDWTPRSVHHKYRQVMDAMQVVENRTGRAASAEEVARQMDVSLDEYHKILADSAGSRLFSYEETVEEPTLQRKQPAAGGPTPDEQLFRTQFREQLAAAIERLPEREALVLSLYYEKELNLKEIGAVLEVSESRVCQIHGQAVMRLKAVARHWS